jgi:hypothetical protein
MSTSTQRSFDVDVKMMMMMHLPLAETYHSTRWLTYFDILRRNHEHVRHMLRKHVACGLQQLPAVADDDMHG